jgi:cytochrome c
MVKEGDNRLGPNLYKIVGRKAGSLRDYAISIARKEAEFVCEDDNLIASLQSPEKVVPGGNMSRMVVFIKRR